MKNNTVIFAAVGIIILGVVGFMIMSGQEGISEATDQVTNTTQNSVVEMTEENYMQEDNMQKKNTIVDIAAGNEQFSTLVTAIQEAGLVETLSGEGPFTVFAPTNEAFEKLPEGTLKNLLQDREQLTSVLTYHVVPGRVMAADVVNQESAQTVQGSEITISAENGTVMVDEAQVIQTDIKASNGVIHVIDSVILPE